MDPRDPRIWIGHSYGASEEASLCLKRPWSHASQVTWPALTSAVASCRRSSYNQDRARARLTQQSHLHTHTYTDTCARLRCHPPVRIYLCVHRHPHCSTHTGTHGLPACTRVSLVHMSAFTLVPMTTQRFSFPLLMHAQTLLSPSGWPELQS